MVGCFENHLPTVPKMALGHARDRPSCLARHRYREFPMDDHVTNLTVLAMNTH